MIVVGFFRETKDDDTRRTHALLDALDNATETSGHPDAPLTEFEEVVLFAVAYDPTQPYPPAGHKYPRRG